MKCQLKYQWVKLPRDKLPECKGIMSAWARMASRAAFREGQARYCHHLNHVMIGEWVGGIVGFKSILGVKRREQALTIAETLASLDYIEFDLNEKTKRLSYRIKDWVVSCSGAPCEGDGTIYATTGYGFLCLPRDITQRLVEMEYKFDEADAWLDLWCHTVWQEPDNAFSHIAPAVQFGRYGAVLSLESLGHRWGWEKTKVWRFFRKYADAFPLQKLPGAFGCVIFNPDYPTGTIRKVPNSEQIERILERIRILGQKTHDAKEPDRCRLAKWVAWYSSKLVPDNGPNSETECRVAVSACPIIRAYFSPCEHCKSSTVDCRDGKGYSPTDFAVLPRAGPENRKKDKLGGFEYGRYEGDPLW